jgi:hypothetical protein
MRRPFSLFALLAIACGVLACDDFGEPRSLTAPTFEGRSLFPSLKKTARQARSDRFEDQIDRVMAGDDSASEAPALAIQIVPLGGGLVSDLPDDGELWRFSRQGSTTLISRRAPGSPPDLMIVARDYSMTAARNPSREFGNFLRDADPTLGMPFDVGKLMQSAQLGNLPLGQLADATGEIEMDQLLDALMGAASLTGGRGLGYRSTHGSFSGWRWVGENEAATTLRIATSRGTWGPQPELPPGLNPSAIQGLLGAAMQAPDAGSGMPSLPGFDFSEFGIDLDDALGALGQTAPTPATQPPETLDEPSPLRVVSERPAGERLPARAARMYLGQVEASPARGSYIAIVCAGDGECPHAAVIARFLDRVRPADGPTGRGTDFETHSASLGLHLH